LQCQKNTSISKNVKTCKEKHREFHNQNSHVIQSTVQTINEQKKHAKAMTTPHTVQQIKTITTSSHITSNSRAVVYCLQTRTIKYLRLDGIFKFKIVKSYLCVCVCINQGGINHNCIRQRLVIRHSQTF